ncbi:hypothetical protein PV326_013665 [Microctonus aethiopoides]|nr:hypothetical protein PV326_013665 [Microctonus aethiopoides]
MYRIPAITTSLYIYCIRMTTEKVLTNVDNFKHEPNPYVTYLKHNSGHDDAISYLGKHVNITYLFEVRSQEKSSGHPCNATTEH